MERRSFLASLAALFVARKLPDVPSHPFVRASGDGLYPAELSYGSPSELLKAMGVWEPLPMSAYVRFTEHGTLLPNGQFELLDHPTPYIRTS